MRRLNFGNWRIVDIDHYMRGNSFFSRQMKELEWINNVNKSGNQKTVVVNDKDDAEFLDQQIKDYLKALNIKQPRSNRGLERLIDAAEHEAMKKQEAAKAEEARKQKKQQKEGDAQKKEGEEQG